MRDAAGAEKLFLKLRGGAHYRRIAQVHRVAGSKQQSHGLGIKINKLKHVFNIFIKDYARFYTECKRFSHIKHHQWD